MASATTDDPATRTRVVLVADKLDPAGVAILEEAGIEARFQPGMSPEELVAAVADVDGLLVRSAAKVTAEVLAAAPRLQAVGRAGIGVDNIDVKEASRRGVLVMNTPLANATTTAELAIAHVLSLARHLPAADASMKAGRWDKSALVGREVTGKTLCVVGLGKIGRLVAERGLGLKMDVIAHDPFLTGASPVPGVELVTFEEALERADYLTLHVPKSPETVGLVDAAAMARMKDDACLVNCSRGGIVVEDDLVAALKGGQLGGAALDVFESEPLPDDSPLREVANLQLTPHLGASSSEAQQRVSTEIAKQMADYLLHDEARCAVNAATVSSELLNVLRPYLSLARRSGLLLAQVADSPVTRVEISYSGELLERPLDPLRVAALTGLLAPALDGPVNAVNAEALAAERGLQVLEERTAESGDYASLLKLRVFTQDGAKHSLAGTLFRGEARLVRFEGFGIDVLPDGHMLLTRHHDAPGVLGQVTTLLGAAGVNIGGLHMCAPRHEGDTALALYELDRPLAKNELDALMVLEPLVEARPITL